MTKKTWNSQKNAQLNEISSPSFHTSKNPQEIHINYSQAF